MKRMWRNCCDGSWWIRLTKQMNHRRIQCLLCELAQECPYSSFLAKPGSGAGGGSGLSAGGGGSRSGVLYEDRPGLGRGGVSLGCSLHLGPRGEFGLGFFGAFGRMNLVSSLAGGGRICPAALGVMVLAFALVGRLGVSMSITLPAGRRVLRVGDFGRAMCPGRLKINPLVIVGGGGFAMVTLECVLVSSSKESDVKDVGDFG